MDNQTRDEEAGLAANNNRQRPRASLPSLLFLTVLIFMLTSHSGDEFLARHQHQEALRALTWQLSNYTAWMNGTESDFSLPEQDEAIHPLLDSFGIVGEIQDPNWSSYYSNITGFIRGEGQFYNITPSALALNTSRKWTPYAEALMSKVNLTGIPDKLGVWDWEASKQVSLSVTEKLSRLDDRSESAVLIHGKLEVTDQNTSEDLRLEFEGVHFLANGSIYGFAVPPTRHLDIRLLPSLVPEDGKNITAQLIEPELEARITKLRNLIDDGVLDDLSNEDQPKSTCTFTIYSQLSPVDIPQQLMADYESELQNPTGAWTVKPPPLSVNSLIISEECGIIFELVDSKGLSSKSFFRKVTNYAAMMTLAYFALILLSTRQTRRSRTPSGLSRVSRWVFLPQAALDCVAFAGHITFAVLAEGRTSLALLAPAFLACVLFLIEVQFSLLVHQIQIPEDVAPPPPTPPPAPAAPQDQTTPGPTTGTPAPPRPTPTPPHRQSFFSFFIHHIQTDPQAKLWLMWFAFLTVIVRVVLSPLLSMMFIGITHTSFWSAQIVRSARRGRTSGLDKEFVIGTTICRLVIALYFISCPQNVLNIVPKWWSGWLALLVCFQAGVLILQEHLGPSFFLPERFSIKKTYDYHPPLPLPDPESPDPSLGDCPICMDAILVDPHHRRSKSLDEKSWGDKPGKPSGAGAILNRMQLGVESASARKSYSLAPCHHLFHTECLERWLAVKNICPQCRRPLPPL
ncbi:hypothetical protein BDN72DRAFT_817637 [Pluteus cervinus]|uniref:Uncharacterized protein n=1 Tax=Pluteus cervinus TaxID=181527 RepID=A0ACD3B0E8_9AGAR|nr:hypothetical protein BDN72DRAFT_817637 [Pluteus cervinus]